MFTSLKKRYEDYRNGISIRKNYTVTDKADGERNLLIVSSDSKVYLRINSNKRISGRGGNGGQRGQGGASNGQNGQRALYTRTPFIIDNGGIIAGGGGGGGGGRNGTITQQVQETNNCMKGSQCTNQ